MRLERQTGPASQQPLLGVSSGKVVGTDVANLDFGLVEHAFPMQSRRELVSEPPSREEASEEPKLRVAAICPLCLPPGAFSPGLISATL